MSSENENISIELNNTDILQPTEEEVNPSDDTLTNTAGNDTEASDSTFVELLEELKQMNEENRQLRELLSKQFTSTATPPIEDDPVSAYLDSDRSISKRIFGGGK